MLARVTLSRERTLGGFQPCRLPPPRFPLNSLPLTRSPLRCHPERSEGSAFLSGVSFSLHHHHSLPLSPTSVNSVPSALKSPRHPDTRRSVSTDRDQLRVFDSSSFNSKLSTFNSCPTPFPAARRSCLQLLENKTTLSPAFANVDAASSLTPLFATLTKNTRGWGSHPSSQEPILFCLGPRLFWNWHLRRNPRAEVLSLGRSWWDSQSWLSSSGFHRSRITDHDGHA